MLAAALRQNIELKIINHKGRKELKGANRAKLKL
jgi:hypothetical protein